MSETFRAKGGEIYLKKGGVMYQPDFPSVPFRLGLYPVVDSVAWIERLLACGVRTIQLRIRINVMTRWRPMWSPPSRWGVATTRLFINDYWRLAVKHRAYGVHLGQEDTETTDLSAIRDAGLRLGCQHTTTWRSAWRWRLALRTSHLAMFFRRRPNRCPLPHRG